MSHKCNEYIIKDGRFVRRFEEMYRNVDDPWDQCKNHCNDLMNNSAFWYLNWIIKQKNLSVRRILDIGCADGYYSDFLLGISGGSEYTGTDISGTIIKKAKKRYNIDSKEEQEINFLVDDIRVKRKEFISTFDLIYCSQTIYYVAPEIEKVLDNIEEYLSTRGLLCFCYNSVKDAFSNKWLTYEKLRKKVLVRRFNEKVFVEINRFDLETFVIGVYEKY